MSCPQFLVCCANTVKKTGSRRWNLYVHALRLCACTVHVCVPMCVFVEYAWEGVCVRVPEDLGLWILEQKRKRFNHHAFTYKEAGVFNTSSNFSFLYYFCAACSLTVPPQQLTFENKNKIQHRSRLQCWKIGMASGTYWKLRVLYNAVYKKCFLFVSLCLFLPGQDPSEGWLVSASGNNAFKADFIRWTPKRKAFKVALKEIRQATWHMVCMCLCGWTGVRGVEGHGLRCHVQFHQPSVTFQTSCTVQLRALSLMVQQESMCSYYKRGEHFIIKLRERRDKLIHVGTKG